MAGKLTSQEVRRRIDHPVVDGDGHWLEFGPELTCAGVLLPERVIGPVNAARPSGSP